MKAKLDEWNAELDKLEAKAAGAEADAKANYQTRIAALKKQRDEARQKLDQMQSASGSAWQDLRSGLDAAWDKLGRAFKDARERFK